MGGQLGQSIGNLPPPVQHDPIQHGQRGYGTGQQRNIQGGANVYHQQPQAPNLGGRWRVPYQGGGNIQGIGNHNFNAEQANNAFNQFRQNIEGGARAGGQWREQPNQPVRPNIGGIQRLGGWGPQPNLYQQQNPLRGPYPTGPRREVAGYNPGMTLEESLNSRTNDNRPRYIMGARDRTNVLGEFTRSMTQISRNPSSTSQGSVARSIELKDQLNEQLQMALAINLGLNGPQEVKERALHNVLTTKSARGDLKQILQSRAEIYGDSLDPN